MKIYSEAIRVARRRTVAMACLRLSLIAPVALNAQWGPRSVASAGMAGVSSAALWIGEGNPSGSVLRERPAVAVAFVPGLFSLPELRRAALAVSGPMGKWGMELHLMSYGGGLFREHAGSFGLAYAVSRTSGVGISAGTSLWSASGYPSLWQWNGGAGFLYQEDGIQLGMRARANMSQGMRSGSQIILGMSAEPASGWLVMAELRQDSGYPLAIRYALSSALAEMLRVTLGWQDDPQVIGLGLRFVIEDMEVSYGGNWHAVLGWTQAMGLALLL